MIYQHIKVYSKNIASSLLLKTAGIYTVSKFINASIPFLLLPILTKYLSIEDYGIVTMFTTLASFTMPFISFNINSAVSRVYYKESNNISEYIWNAILLFLFSLILISVLFLIFSQILSKYFALPVKWVLLIPLFCSLSVLPDLMLVLWQVKIKALHYGIFQFFQTFSNAILSVLLVVTLKMHWQGRIIGIIIASIFATLISIFILFRDEQIEFHYNSEYIKHAIKFGGGLIPHTIGGMLIVMTNRIFLTNMLGLEETGLYGVAFQIASVLGFLTAAFNNAYVPILFEKLSKELINDKIKLVRNTYYYFIILSLIGLLSIIFLPLIFSFFIHSKFIGGIKYCSWLIIGFVFQGMYFMVTNFVIYAEKTILQALVTVIVGILNIFLNYMFIKYFGGIGAAISYAVTFALFFIFTWLLSSRVFEMPWTYFLIKNT